MIAALALAVVSLLTLVTALAAMGLSIASFRRHMTVKQLLFSTLIGGTAIGCTLHLVASLAGGSGVSLFTVALTAASLLAAVIQFGTAMVFGTIDRLRSLARA